MWMCQISVWNAQKKRQAMMNQLKMPSLSTTTVWTLGLQFQKVGFESISKVLIRLASANRVAKSSTLKCFVGRYFARDCICRPEATAPLGLSKRGDASKQDGATSSSGDHLKFVSQWASRALGDTADSNISRRKPRRKFRNKNENYDGNQTREKKDVLISLKSQKSVVTHHAINRFRSLLAKF
ncbi:hypothetical protein AHF37_07150 [Paragonimus kellicotti]|nr:hypothetical protein AHF37_07150 [Paragonimus kellicotti]